MKVFKFGGASVNSADAVRNMSNIVQSHHNEPLIVVVSAMGKTTNLLEKMVPQNHDASLRNQLEDYHRQIAKELMPSNQEIQNTITSLLAEIDHNILSIADNPDNYNYRYDQIVSFGELLSTHIIAAYLTYRGIAIQWVDARKIILTDNHYRESHIDWEATQNAVCKHLSNNERIIITQGFIAGTSDSNSTTTLGREGSDYSAAVIAYCINAEEVTIWKDVPGFLNADPKFFSPTIKISHLPYNDAIELAYYGASVIHPKTVKPLQNKGVPLRIKSFLNPSSEGSIIGKYSSVKPATPLYIFRNDQILLSIMPRDFSFIAEDKLQVIFSILNEVGVRVNLMQNSALSFSICIDNNAIPVKRLMERLRELSFRVRYNDGLQLITIRYYTEGVIKDIVKSRIIMLEQRSRLTAQLVVPA